MRRVCCTGHAILAASLESTRPQCGRQSAHHAAGCGGRLQRQRSAIAAQVLEALTTCERVGRHTCKPAAALARAPQPWLQAMLLRASHTPHGPALRCLGGGGDRMRVHHRQPSWPLVIALCLASQARERSADTSCCFDQLMGRCRLLHGPCLPGISSGYEVPPPLASTHALQPRPPRRLACKLAQPTEGTPHGALGPQPKGAGAGNAVGAFDCFNGQQRAAGARASIPDWRLDSSRRSVRTVPDLTAATA